MNQQLSSPGFKPNKCGLESLNMTPDPAMVEAGKKKMSINIMANN